MKIPILPISLFLTVFAAALGACKLPGWDTDLEAFVDYGRTIACLDSASYVQDSGVPDTDVVPGSPVIVTVKIKNPNEIALSYTIGVDSSLVAAGIQAPEATPGAEEGITTVSFSFTPTESAEHGDIAFSLGLEAPTLNRSFPPATFTVRCDSAPNPVSNLKAGIRNDGRACIGFTLPEGYADADISAVEITYASISASSLRTVTEPVSRTGTGLTAMPSPSPLSSTAGAYERFFIPDDVVADNDYSFTVKTIDASGKKSRTASSASIAANMHYLQYDANDGTGNVATAYAVNGTSVTIAYATPLSRTGYAFTGWNTQADGTGASYLPGDEYTLDADATLYAQWEVSVNASLASALLQGPCTAPTSISLSGELSANDWVLLDQFIEDSSDSTVTLDLSNLTNTTIPQISSAADPTTEIVSIKLPNGVTAISQDCFNHCVNLVSVTLPATLNFIGGYSFSGCTALTTLVIPASVTEISGGAFYGCSSLTAITFEPGSQLTKIASQAFNGCSSLTSIDLPDSITELVNGYTFPNCTALTSIHLPAGITAISSSMFADCTSLASITIPAAVNNIEANVFSGCSALANITMESTDPCTLGTGAFASCSASLQIHVPTGYVAVYQAAANWSDYASKIVTP